MMKKVTALIGSNRKQGTYEAVRQFGESLKSRADIDFEIVFCKDYQMEYCRGCKRCFDQGEGNCPTRGDRDRLIEKIAESDGIILAAPNYAFQVPAVIKNALDHLAFLFHRPRFFGKTCTAVVTQGFFGGRTMIRYLSTMGQNLGFRVTRGCVLQGLEPLSETARKQNARVIERAAARFARALSRPAYPAPSLYRLMMFRLSRTMLRHQDASCFDRRYFQEKGWLTSDYYYETNLGFLKKWVGRLFDLLGRWIARIAA